VTRMDLADGSGKAAHNDRLGVGAVCDVADAFQKVAARDSGCSEHDATTGKVVSLKNAVDIAFDHLFGPSALLGISKDETSLHVTTDTPNGRGSDNAFRRAPGAHKRVDTGERVDRCDGERDIAVGDEANSRAGASNFGN